MLSVMDVIGYISSLTTYTYYANEFPASAGDDIAFVRLTGGGSPSDTVKRPSIQVVVRGTAPADVEALANEIQSILDQSDNFDMGQTHVIYCSAQTSTPLYLGQDDNNRFMYSLNFNLITE